MIEIDNVSQVFRTSGRQDHLALSGISLAIEGGAFFFDPRPLGLWQIDLALYRRRLR
jgi:hypothetical protein